MSECIDKTDVTEELGMRNVKVGSILVQVIM